MAQQQSSMPAQAPSIKQQASQTIADLKRKSSEQLYAIRNQPATRMTLELIVTIFMVILLAIAAIRPTLLAMSQLLKDIEDRKKTDEALNKKIDALSALSVEILPLKSDLQLLDTVLPNTADVIGYMKRLEKIASQNKITVTSIQTQTVPKNEIVALETASIVSLDVTVQVKGSYLEIKQFIQDIQTMDRFTQIKSVSISSSRELKIENTQLATIELQSFYLGAPAKTDSNAAPTKQGEPEI